MLRKILNRLWCACFWAIMAPILPILVLIRIVIPGAKSHTDAWLLLIGMLFFTLQFVILLFLIPWLGFLAIPAMLGAVSVLGGIAGFALGTQR